MTSFLVCIFREQSDYLAVVDGWGTVRSPTLRGVREETKRRVRGFVDGVFPPRTRIGQARFEGAANGQCGTVSAPKPKRYRSLGGGQPSSGMSPRMDSQQKLPRHNRTKRRSPRVTRKESDRPHFGYTRP
jgi:hypothetical protein